MGVTVETDITCDGKGCNDWTFGVTGHPGPQQKAARKNARKNGWRRVKNPNNEMSDLCPDCYKNYISDLVKSGGTFFQFR